MRKLVVILTVFFALVGCKDEFNLPEYDSGVEDLEKPVITVISPSPNQVITGATSVPLEFNFSDDVNLAEIQVQITPINSTVSGYSTTVEPNDTLYTLNDTYTIQATDSIVYDVLVIAGDDVGNVSNESYQFTTK